MWDDLPQKMSGGTKALIIIIAILVLAGLTYSGYLLFKPPAALTETNISPIPSISAKISGRPFYSPSPLISPSPSPSPSAKIDYQVPEGETLINHSTADTNGDGQEETLVITKMANGKYHVYVLSSAGSSLFDNQELTKKPIRIALQTYDSTKDSFLSWMLVFTENSGDLAFIHWNGTAYEIPQNELGI